MKVVIDEKIPFLRDALVDMGCEVLALPGSAITRDDVLQAEALFVRTRTICDEALLQGAAVRFIGTATIGYDHIDTAYCESNGVTWTNAAGCNADAVLQYVQAVVYTWAKEKNRSLAGLTMGVVGVGEIGSRVARWAASEGMRLVLNDPPREKRGDDGFSSLASLAEQSDIITFHPTLSVQGEFPSYHLADDAFFAFLGRCALFINASRGPVVDNAALLRALERNGELCAALDVWENEPAIDIALLNKVYIGTPHIAGYSAEGKINATTIVLEAFARFFGCTEQVPSLSLPAPSPSVVQAASFAEAALKVYSPLADSQQLKNNPAEFENLRNNYNLRREVSAYKLQLDEEKC